MLNGLKICVVLPAYNAESTLVNTYREIPLDIVDDVILVDDCSSDKTTEVALRLGIKTISHQTNLGYGGNQKTCYREAIARGADIIVMVHPDYQYSPKLVAAMAAMISYREYDLVLGSRILAQNTVSGGMPVYKYVSNRLLTFTQNLLLRQKLSEYHTGFRAFSRKVLETLPLDKNSNDFVFDNQILIQAMHHGFRIGEISCPTKYDANSSSISLPRSVKYGLGVLSSSVEYLLYKHRGRPCSFL